MSNKSMGNEFEKAFCEILSKNYFWVHNMAQNQAGQPADVIACKHGKAYLIDCKVCHSDSFPLSRIEPNQEMSMNLWGFCGNGTGYFAVIFPDSEIWMLKFSSIRGLLESGKSAINRDFFPHIGETLERWLQKHS